MGFGLLLVGYTLVLCMSAYTALPAFIGYYIIMYGCLKLAEYEERFRTAAWVMGGAACVFACQSMMGLLNMAEGNTLLSDLSENLQPVFEFAFYASQLVLLPALAAIARDTGRKRTEFACKRNILLLALMFCMYLVCNYLIRDGFEYSRYCIMYLLASRYLALILMMVQVFSCYMWICREGEEEEESAQEESKLNRHFTRPFGKKDRQEEAPKEELPAWRKVRDKRKRK